jgi:hypothetical protein
MATCFTSAPLASGTPTTMTPRAIDIDWPKSCGRDTRSEHHGRHGRENRARTALRRSLGGSSLSARPQLDGPPWSRRYTLTGPETDDDEPLPTASTPPDSRTVTP